MRPGIGRALRSARRALGRTAVARSAPVRRFRKRLRRVQPSADPLVSLVIPFYNVEAYLDECIESVRAQTYRNLQIILVDDDSPDDSILIARRHAAEDPRIQIVEKPNGGLGQARNVGTRSATGQFLVYLDSDDTIVPDAVDTLLRTLQRSGSDFAICAYKRFTDDGRSWEPERVRSQMRHTRVGVTIDDEPDILAQHVFMWAKMFRTEFFRQFVGGCPEGTRYEDQEPSARAYVHARQFDVVSRRLFNWRSRNDQTSLTQQKHTLADVEDRLTVVGKVAQILRADASPRVFDEWAARVAVVDMALYLAQVPRVQDARYWDTLRGGLLGFIDQLTPGAWDAMDAHARVLLEAVKADNRDDILTVLAHVQDSGRLVRLRPEGSDFHAELPYDAELSTRVGDAHLRVPADSILARVGLLSLTWLGAGELSIKGWAYLEGLPADDPSYRVRVDLVDLHDGTRLALPVVRFVDPVVREWSADPYNDQSGAAFEVSVDMTQFDASGPGEEPSGQKWAFEVTVVSLGVERTAPFSWRIADGGLAQVPVPALSDGARLMPAWSLPQGLVLSWVRPTWHLGDCRLEGRQLTVRFRHADGDLPERVVVDQLAVSAESDMIEIADDGWATATVAVPEAVYPDGQGGSWRVRAHGRDGSARMLGWIGDAPEFYAGQPALARLHPRITSMGFLRLADSSASAVVDEVELGSDRVVYRGFIDPGAAAAPVLELRNDSDVLAPTSFSWNRQTLVFRAEFDMVVQGRAVRPGTTVLVLSSPDFDEPHPAVILETAAGHLPSSALSGQVQVRASRSYYTGQPRIKVAPPLRGAEASAWGLRSLLSQYRDSPQPVDDGAMLFESFSGRLVADSPRSIYEEVRRRSSDIECYWTIKDHSVQPPDGCTPVLLHSEEYIRTLHTAKYLVNDNNFPHYFRKRPGQYYLQTWHGTPLKRIGNDVPGFSLSLSYRALMKRETTYWDALLAQNEFAAGVFPRAFGYSGPVWQVGYPRNDSLVAGDPQAVRARVREALGLADNQQAVLYAPTWRDTERSSRGYAMVTHLDFARVSEELGAGTIVLLRGHRNTEWSARPETALDVTDYPEVNELFLAADVLITDYSSLMFDFALTGKPILLLVPDLEVYRDVTRGFYLDLEEIAPGPLLMDGDGVIAELRRLRESGPATDDSYPDFRDRFAPQDDGHAAGRVVDRLLSRGWATEVAERPVVSE